MNAQAIGIEDHLHARRDRYRRKVDAALEKVRSALKEGRIGVAFSGGKDSTVLLDIVRKVDPDAPAAFYDSGAEFDWTYRLVEALGVETIQPQATIIDLFKRAGEFGYVEPGKYQYERIDYEDFLIYEPAERFVASHDLQVLGLGLRASENTYRRISAQKRGELYRVDYASRWHLCPLAFWNDDDIWAYIASAGLNYNEAYDRMAALGIERKRWRVSTLIGGTGATIGRFAILRKIAPQKFYELAETFPNLNKYA